MNSPFDEQKVKEILSNLHRTGAGMDLIEVKLKEMKRLAQKASSKDCSVAERERLQLEINRLIKEIDELTH